MPTIYPFDSANLPTQEQAGGKARALIEMIRARMPVPPGFVLTVDFFKPWLDILKTSSHWPAFYGASTSEILPACHAVQALCQYLNLTPQQNNDLQQALDSLDNDNHEHLYAVRSSSPEEDLQSASFAGSYATTLGVTRENLEAAIRGSFASSFDERVWVYKKENGFHNAEPRIAVIVQQQVNADSAGVAFSINPLNNSFDEAVINANHGLGESVVAGEAEPDLFVVDKPTRQILEARAGRKQSVIRLDRAGGTSRVARQNQVETAITNAQVFALTELLESIETYYQKPVDIEWAIAGGSIFLLQARPVTTYLPLPPEMITPPGAPKRLYANSTLIEQGLQEPLSVLGTDFLSYVLNKVGGRVAEGSIGIDGITFTASGGYYMNVSYAQMMGMPSAGLAPGSSGDPRVLEILNSIDMREYTRGKLPARLKAGRRGMIFKALPMMKPVLVAYLWPKRVLADYLAGLPEELRRLRGFSGDGLSLHEQAVAITDLLSFFYGGYDIGMILAGQFAQQRIRKLFKNDANTQDHLTNLGVSLPGNKTAEMGERMYRLASAEELNRFNDAGSFLSALEEGTLSPAFVQEWKQYLSEFGMRCPGEIDPATPRPYEQPERIFAQLKSLAQAILERKSAVSFFEEARAKREAAYHALHDIALRKGKLRAKTFERLYHIWLTLGGYRETPKHYVITVIDLFRRSALLIGERLSEQGRLDSPTQVFDLTISQIDQALVDPAFDLRKPAVEQAALIQKIRKSKHTARILDSRGKIFYPPRKASAVGELNGIPISPGVVRGCVKVLQTADEKPLLPGEILVARATDPGWTPLFINAKGIILEIGGALQHGAVVAREYGIPCVSGVDNATGLFQDGQMVEVDGSRGTIRVLDGNIPANAPLSDFHQSRLSC